MTLGELLARIGEHLDRAGIPYMVTGSIASSFYGEPRTTRDLDIVIDPTPEALSEFVHDFPPSEYYVDLDAATQALADRWQFNVIEIASGWKVDLVIRRDRPFSVEEFSRRQATELLGTPTYVATAEDTIIAKLEWAKAGESERQLRDVAAILAVSGDTLDHAYLDRWIEALGLQDVWSQVGPRRHLPQHASDTSPLLD